MFVWPQKPFRGFEKWTFLCVPSERSAGRISAGELIEDAARRDQSWKPPGDPAAVKAVGVVVIWVKKLNVNMSRLGIKEGIQNAIEKNSACEIPGPRELRAVGATYWPGCGN